MKPALFDYVVPESVADALKELASDDMARPLAGGQSLIPTMNFRIATPSKLVDLRKISELKGISVDNGVIRIGAMTRHRELELDAAANQANPLIAEIMSNVAHIIVRNRGTIGGSIAHADAAAELPCLLVATGGSVEVTGAAGKRTIEAEDLFQFHMTTSIGEGELLTEVRIPGLPPHTGYAFQEVARRHGDYALAGVCALVGVKGGTCTSARLAACGIGSKATRLANAESALIGTTLDEASLDSAGTAAKEYVTAADDRQASTAYRQTLVATLVRRTVKKAAGRAGE